MSDMNKWCGTGRLTRDSEVRYTPAGRPVTDLGLACNRVWRKEDGERQEQVTFVDVTVWGKQAEGLQQYLKKGTYVLVEGRLELDQWEVDGVKRSKLRVVADRVNLGPRSGSKEEVTVASSSSDDDTPF